MLCRVDIYVHHWPADHARSVDMKEVRPATVERLAWAMSTLLFAARQRSATGGVGAPRGNVAPLIIGIATLEFCTSES